MKLLVLVLVLCVADVSAEPFKRMVLRKVVGSTKDVTWQRNDIISTGWKAQVELEFQDATVVYLGADTQFRFQPGTRKMFLDRGTMFFYSPKEAGELRAGNVQVIGSNFRASYVEQ